MQTTTAAASTPTVGAGSSKRKVILTVLGILFLGCGLAAAATAWWVKHNFYAGPIRPVALSAAEAEAWQGKWEVLTAPAAPRQPTAAETHRTLMISQKEINAYLASRDLGDKVWVNLDHGKITATMLVPIPPDAGLPLISGTTLRVTVSLAAGMDPGKKFSVELNDIRVGGISLPNAWLGQMKGVNLVAENVERDPALQQFLAGIQELEIRPEGLRVLLSE